MNNYKIDNDGKILFVDRSSKVPLTGYKQTNKDVTVGMVLNNGAFENPIIEEIPLSKEEQLSTLIVTISSSKRFYADAESRTDLLSAIIEAQEQGATDASVSNWKTPDGVMAVTLAELKEASKKALETKAGLIGVS